jgi:hypothetical protein
MELVILESLPEKIDVAVWARKITVESDVVKNDQLRHLCP